MTGCRMMPPSPRLVLDFDSTLVSVEGLDFLYARTLGDAEGRARREAEFRRLTDRGMAGGMAPRESLEERLTLLRATRSQVESAAEAMVAHITPSALRSRHRLQRHARRIWIVSGGFRELIEPTLRELGLLPARLRAHRFRWSETGIVAGVDPDTPLARGGKAEALRKLALDGPIWVVGDGANDLALRQQGLADRFLAFVENRNRPSVTARADAVVASFDDLPTLD
ncbi:MAG: HAD-IB family phosphatase [bacterium]